MFTALRRAVTVTGLGLPLLVGSAMAADQEVLAALGCKVTDRSTLVALVLCPDSVTGQALASAGQAACPDTGVRCNAWFWHDDVSMPAKAPVTDAEMPKSVTSRAVAVWVNDSAKLISLRKLK